MSKIQTNHVARRSTMSNDLAQMPTIGCNLKPLSPLLLDRADAIVSRLQSGETQTREPALEGLGYSLRTWRRKKKLSRTEVAHRLQIDVERLLFLETGTATSEDFTEAQIIMLKAMIN